MPNSKFDPTRATMQEAIVHFSKVAPYMQNARSQADLNEMINGYQTMLGGSRDKGLRAEMIAYLRANGVPENDIKLSQGESRSSMRIATGRLRMGWYHRLRFKLLDIFGRRR